MKKLLLALLAAGALSRTEVAAGLATWVAETALRAGVLEPLVAPVLRRSAAEEVKTIAREIQQQAADERMLPSPAGFPAYLRRNQLSGRGVLDPWGMAYRLRLSRDSVVVWSAGPDRVPGTADDLAAGFGR